MAHIRTYARIKPSKRSYDDYEATKTTLYMRVPDVLRDATGQVRTRMSNVNHEFKFTHIFDNQASQEEVFDTVAKDIIDGFLNGYNGTIFAYGQTGSGKTFTVEGSARRYDDRGLAPRALSMIYRELEAREDVEATVHVSYMEIYQEVGYDLLNQAARSSSVVTPFPKVAVVEGARGSCIVRNLSSHLAANEDVAQSLLLQGQANRKVAETPMNQRSSRSHAVFTITLTAKKENAEVITKSKLHLVDLAGSERVSKTGINGQQLAEAKYINLSLHYLEGVIIALHQEAGGSASYRPQSANQSSFYKRVLAERSHPYKRPRRIRSSNPGAGQAQGSKSNNSSNWSSGRPSSADPYRSYSSSKHVPYRNSLLTMVLKDSLGGNCQTAMIATISVEEENLNESLSTCRFSQRVACITNTVRKNEEIDDKLMIKRLRKRIAELETELALLKSGQGGADADLSVMDAKLTDTDKRDCARIVQSYLGGQVSDPILAGVTTPLRFRECMRLFKAMVKSNQSDISRAYSGRPLKAWSEVSEPRPSTVPTNMKMATGSRRAGSDDVRNTSASSQLNTSGASGQSALNHSLDGDRRAPSADSSATKGTGSAFASDLDLRMSQVSLAARDNWSRDGRRPRPHSESRVTSRASSRTSYKSPFERKREKTIKLLAEQVRRKRNEQQEQQEHLKEFQMSLRGQQLGLIHSELRAKADENKKLLDAQHARVKQIKAEGINEELYTQEKLIERQLRKRQAKMEKRLQLVEEQMEQMAQQDTQEAAAAGESKAAKNQSAEVVDPTRMKGYGTVVNTRMVLDKLQEENKKQSKIQNKLERERVTTLSQQIELKEAATRQKLRDFKQKLMESRMGGEVKAPNDSMMAPHSPRTTDDSLASPRLKSDTELTTADLDEAEPEPVKDVNQAPSKPNPFSVNFKFAANNAKPDSSWPADPFPTSKPARSQPSGDPAHAASGSIQPQPRKEHKKKTDDLWAKSYTCSRQSSMVEDSRSRDPFTSGLPGKKDLFGDRTTPKLESSPIKEAGYEDLPLGLLGGLQNGIGSAGEEEPEEDGDRDNGVYDIDTDKVPSKDVPKVKSPREIMRALEEASKPIGSGGKGQSRYNGSRQEATRGEVLMPSEYVNQDHNESFDGKNMGLSHKTFESALKSMLSMEGSERPGPLTIGKADYDEYARRNRMESTTTARTVYGQRGKGGGGRTSERPRRKDAASPSRRPVQSDAWGPEVKNMSISDRLARYLDTDVLPSARSKAGQGQSYDDTAVSPYRKPKVVDEAEPAVAWQGGKAGGAARVVDLDVDDYKPRIKALPEPRREAAYMTTAKEQKERVGRIRRARRAAEVIQRAWHNYQRKKSTLAR